jgi:hypothetical protein
MKQRMLRASGLGLVTIGLLLAATMPAEADDLRSLVGYASHTRPGVRDIVVRATSERAGTLVEELGARHGADLSVFVT